VRFSAGNLLQVLCGFTEKLLSSTGWADGCMTPILLSIVSAQTSLLKAHLHAGHGADAWSSTVPVLFESVLKGLLAG
jgi:hypothetical protein